MRAETRAYRVAAAGLSVLLTAVAPAGAQPPPAPVRDRVAKLIGEGKSLEEVVAAKPAAEFDARWGSPDHMPFLPAIYAELAGRN